jgi:manganese efflux pump family protein
MSGRDASATVAGPPERHFPLPVVIGHGLFATVTIVLVVLTALNVGGS